MNAHQRKKFAKALMSDLKNSTDDEKLQGLVDAAADLAKQGRAIKQKDDRIEQLEATQLRENNRVLDIAIPQVEQLERENAQFKAVIKEQKKTIDRLSALADKWNLECDEMREDNKRLEREGQEQSALIENLSGAVERCYKMLLSEPDTKGALFKAENILRETLADMKEMKCTHA